MSEKKSFLSGLFGGKKSGGCCNLEIVEENDADGRTEEQTPVCVCNAPVEETKEESCCCDGGKCLKAGGYREITS